MDELKMEIALEVIQLKIVHFIKNYTGKNSEDFQLKLRKLANERQKIYELDDDTINKVYDIYLKDIRKENENGKI